MHEWLQRLLAPPVFTEDEEKTRIAYILAPMLLYLLGGLILGGLAILSIVPKRYPTAIVIFTAAGTLLLARNLMKRGQVRNACRLFISVLGLLVFLMVLFAGGITSFTVVLYIALVIVTALFLGRLATTLLTIAIIMSEVGVVLLESANAMPPQAFSLPSSSNILLLTFAAILVTVTLNLALRSLDESRTRYAQELAERKQFEKALTESELRFHTIYDSVNDAIFIHEFETGAILDVNQRMCEMYRYTHQEALQLTIENLSLGESPYTQQEAMEWIRKIPKGGSRLVEWRAKAKDGQLFWVEINVRHTEIAGQGRLLVTARDITDRKRADQMRAALYQISDAARAAQDLEEFYKLVHTVIRTLMPARNFYIAIYDPEADLVSYPYYTDDYDAPPPPHQPDKGLTTYVLHTGIPLLATPVVFERLVAEGAVENVGTPCIDWLGAPLKTTTQVIGVLAVQTYTQTERLTPEDRDILVFISNQVALMLERRRADEHDRKLSHGLRAVIEAADELIRCDRLDTVYRRAVELAREKLGLERCGLFLLDASWEYLVGTYGTDDQGRTTDERAGRIPVTRHPEIFAPFDRLWTILPLDYAYWKEGEHILVGSGWVASTIIRDSARPIGVLYNDTAISQAPPDQAVQETVALFCSLLGNIIERKRLEAREREMVNRLHAIVDSADELIGCENLDTLYRRAIELAREKLNVERCSIFLLDENHDYLLGTYGTDDKGRTTDERDIRWPAEGRPEIFVEGGQNRLIREADLRVFWENGIETRLDKGWIAYTLIRIGDEPIGVFCNDSAISHTPSVESVQETLAIYCSLLGNIIKRMRVEVEQKKLIAKLEAKNSELERFSYTVSHDLKAPLITIRGFLGYLEKDANSGNVNRMHEDITRISEATNKMQQLLNELLELSRIGRLMNPGQLIPFEEIVRDAMEIVRGQIEACGAEIILEDGLPYVFVDRVRLVEVVQNLLENAVKFSRREIHPRIEIGARGTDDIGRPILFVRDNGIGIEPQYHERIFGLFNKLDTQSEGTGIGLALVKRIIEFHGGHIWVESAGQGQGSTFCFILPVIAPQEERVTTGN